LAAPKGLPAPIVKRMNEEVVKALNEPELKSKLEGQGFIVVGSTPQQAAEFVASEVARWTQVVKGANIKMD
jgi:tripartite-type tricarboxylate transporter receptor subunit TctC